MLPKRNCWRNGTLPARQVGCLSRRLQGVHLVDILVGRSSEVELLSRDPVVTGAAESQCPFKVKQLAHEVEVRGDVGFLHLDNVVSIVHGQVELLHKVSNGDGDRAADACQAMHQDPAVFASGFICEHKKKGKISVDWKPPSANAQPKIWIKKEHEKTIVVWQLSPKGSRKMYNRDKHVHGTQWHISDSSCKENFCIKFLPTKNSLMCAFFASAREYQKPCNMALNASQTDKQTARVY